MPRNILIGGSLLATLGLVILVLSQALTIDAQNVNEDLNVPSLVQGGVAYTFPWSGPKYDKFEISLDAGRSWQELAAQGSGDIKVQLPKEDTNEAQVRITLPGPRVIPSDLFSIDSTAPTTVVRVGSSFVRDGRIFVPFNVVGPDVESVELSLTNRVGITVVLGRKTVAEAEKDGFQAPEDGKYSLTLIAHDRVGNAEVKTAPDEVDVIVDETEPSLSIDLAFPSGRSASEGLFAMGGETLGVSYTIQDANPEFTSARFEVVGIDPDGTEKVLAQIDPGNDLSAAGRFDWLVPYDDWGQAWIRLSAADASSNRAEISSQRFAVFAGTPEAFIVRESARSDGKLGLTINYLHIEGFANLSYPKRVEIYEGAWDENQRRFVWDLDNPHKDTVFLDAKETEIEISTQRQNRAYTARLVAGSGVGADRAKLTETLPNEHTQPESIWIDVDRVRRIQLVDLPPEERIVTPEHGVTLLYTVPSASERGTQLVLEYSTDGGQTWLPITPTPVDVDLNAVGEQAYVWANPPKDIKYATVRAVTQFVSANGVLYRVQDIMNGGLIIDGSAPAAVISRVLDRNGRALRSGDYTNSSQLHFEWRASDRGSAGLSYLTLWDNVATTSKTMNAREFDWSDKEFQSESIAPTSTARRIDPLSSSYTVSFGAIPRPIGQLGFVLEAVDRAGNRLFPNGMPKAQPAHFFLNVDLMKPQAKIVNAPARASYRPGETITLSWEAWDNAPDPLIQGSLEPNPVSIHVIYGGSAEGVYQRSTLATNLPARGSTDIIVPALVDKDIRFLITARDKAGNESSLSDEAAMSKAAPVRNLKVPEARLKTPILSDDGRDLILTWDVTEGEPGEVNLVTLWVRTSPLEPFVVSKVSSATGRISFALPAEDVDYEFAVTAHNIHGLTEPVPSTAEERYAHDVQAPKVDLMIVDPEVDDPTNADEVAIFVKEKVPDPTHYPNVWARVSDLHFAAKNVALTLERSGATGSDSMRTAGIANDTWINLGTMPITRAETIRAILTALDSTGNRSEIVKTLVVQAAPDWEFIGLDGSEPYYTNTQRYLFWKANESVARGGKIDLAIQKVILDADTGRYINDGQAIPIANGVIDNSGPDGFGRYFLEEGLPSIKGHYHFLLSTTDANGKLRTAKTHLPAAIIEPHPELSLNPELNLDPSREGRERINTDGVAREYVFKGVRSKSISIEVRDDSNAVGWYPLPPEKKSGLRLRYRFQGPKMDAPGPWMPKQFAQPTSPATAGTQLELGSYLVDFMPDRGEGRYEIIPEFTDIYGHQGFWPGEQNVGVVLIFDAGAPQVKLDAGLGRRSFITEKELEHLYVSAEDPLLLKSTMRLEYHTADGWRAMPLKGEMTVDNETAKSKAGFIFPDFATAGRYELRFVAEDELGQMGIAELGAPIYAGRANYVASHPLPLHDDDPVYTNAYYSRRPDFRVRVDPVNPWPEDVGLAQLTLWWRMVTPNQEHVDQWHPIDFKDQWLIGQLEGDWLLPGTRDHFISLPFTAERSGKYQFVVTSQSMYEQLEDPETEPAYGRPRTIPRDTTPEYEATVYVAGSAVEMQMPSEGPNLVEEQVDSLEQGRVQQLETYLISWTYTTSVENDENIDDIDFTLEFFDGVNWQSAQALTPAPENDPRIGLLTYTTNVAENRSDMLGNRLKVRTYRAYWKCPPVVEDVEGFTALLRINAREKTKNSLPPLSYVAASPGFRVGEPHPRSPQHHVDYYERKLEDGRKELSEGHYWEAIRHFRDARLEEDTHEVNTALAEAYSKVGDHQRAEYHREHAARPGVVDHLR